jgi:hypothetical protein
MLFLIRTHTQDSTLKLAQAQLQASKYHDTGLLNFMSDNYNT